jgi:hypothetical protein
VLSKPFTTNWSLISLEEEPLSGLCSKMNCIKRLLTIKTFVVHFFFNSKQLATHSEIESSKMVVGSTTDGSWYRKGSVYAKVEYPLSQGVILPVD